MGMFDDVVTEIAGVSKEETDSLGGFQSLDSGMHQMRLKMVYMHKSAGGAKAVTIIGVTKDKIEHKETIYWTASAENGGLNTYKDKNSGETRFNPGWLKLNSLCEMLLGKGFGKDLVIEKRTVAIYSKDAGGEVNTQVDAIVELMDKKLIRAGIIKKRENAQENVGGKWVNKTDGSERVSSTIDKIFHNDTKQTPTEYAKGIDAKFYEGWLKKNDGVTRDFYKEPVATPGAPTQGAASTSADDGEDLFADD